MYCIMKKNPTFLILQVLSATSRISSSFVTFYLAVNYVDCYVYFGVSWSKNQNTAIETGFECLCCLIFNETFERLLRTISEWKCLSQTKRNIDICFFQCISLQICSVRLSVFERREKWGKLLSQLLWIYFVSFHEPYWIQTVK